MYLIMFFACLALICGGAILTVLSLIAREFRYAFNTWRLKRKMSRSWADGDELTKAEIYRFYCLTCPDCGSRLLEGPSAGVGTNYRCSKRTCMSAFNFIGMHIIRRISNASPGEPPAAPSHEAGPYRRSRFN